MTPDRIPAPSATPLSGARADVGVDRQAQHQCERKLPGSTTGRQCRSLSAATLPASIKGVCRGGPTRLCPVPTVRAVLFGYHMIADLTRPM